MCFAKMYLKGRMIDQNQCCTVENVHLSMKKGLRKQEWENICFISQYSDTLYFSIVRSCLLDHILTAEEKKDELDNNNHIIKYNKIDHSRLWIGTNGNVQQVHQLPIKSKTSAYLDSLGKNHGGFFDFSLALPASTDMPDFCWMKPKQTLPPPSDYHC